MIDEKYISLLKDVINNGDEKNDRTGTGTLSVFGREIRHSMKYGFPLLTTKKVIFKSVKYELLWFIGNHMDQGYEKYGRNNIKFLVDNGVNIWNDWPHKNYIEQTGENIDISEFKQLIKEDEEFAKNWGDCGPIYGEQWRNMGGVDQLSEVVENLKNKPYSRRHVVSAWNPKDIPYMALPPCHMIFQFNVRPLSNNGKVNNKDYDHKLDIKIDQRSCDLGLGVPFNLASYALLLKIVSNEAGMVPGDLIWSGGDVHIYKDHIEKLKEQIDRKPFDLPSVNIENKGIFDLTADDIELQDYEHHPHIKLKVSV